MTCGTIFNRHKWKYFHEYYRMCTKCGITQESSYSSSMSGYWWTLDFEEWTKRLEERFLMDSLEEKRIIKT